MQGTAAMDVNAPRVYVDEAKGHDESGQGTEAAPYATALGAMLARGPDVSILSRKDEGYEPLSASGVKKAKKLYDMAIKKKQKAAELASQEAERAEQDKKGWKPALPRARKVSTALKAYALLATSADKGAVRDKALLDG